MVNFSQSAEQLVSESNQGYIALYTVIILGLTSLGLALSVTADTLSHSADIISTSQFQQAVELTRSCLERARTQFLLLPQYTGGETITIADNSCTIISVDKLNDTITIITNAQYQNSQAKIKTILTSQSLAIVSQQLIN